MNGRGLDERWLPVLAERAHAWRARLRRLAERVAGVDSPVGVASRSEPALAGSIATVLVAGLLIGGFGTHDPYDPKEPPSDSALVPPPVSATLGAAPGASVPSYLDSAAFRLRHFGETGQGRTTFALVSLSRYETPAQLTAALAGVPVERVYLHVPASQFSGSIYPVAVHTLPADLLTAMTAMSRGAGVNARLYARTAEALHGKSKPEQQQRALIQELATSLGVDAAAFARPASCVCVFAAIVRADDTTLAALARKPDVRAVDPADPSLSLTELTVYPLRPDTTTVVPRAGMFGG